MLKKSLIIKTCGKANDNQIHIGQGFRVTVLTNGIVRIESNKNNAFNDLPSTVFINRKQDISLFNVEQEEFIVKITTEKVIIYYNLETNRVEKVHFIKEDKTITEFEKENLFGTCRTLDHTTGRVPLEKGLISKNGVAIIDDSNSFLFDESGHFVKRKGSGKDIYVFAYLNEPQKCIEDFFKISGKVPLLPRYSLGVWWSRYRQYTQQEYIDLMEKFEKEKLPITVATVDMDWHWTDLNSKFGTSYPRRTDVENTVTGGWTGYSWNTDLFPDYKAFLKYLKSKNLHITLNLHPADGVRFFENQYDDMAKAMGIDPKTKEDIKFQVGNDNFWNNYFDILHKPYEKEGVDFWWIDWQQGTESDVPDLDPLLPLNHYHYLDNCENGQKGLILSRYGGLGSHRYPVGFSGDTDISWDVLDFQPYFTSTAANCGYTWWSHDIGGHHNGIRDEQLYLRWIEFGVFSPVMRLHSTSNDLLGKEPWNYSYATYVIAKDWLRLRHYLLPFLYSANYETHINSVPICKPMYYDYPENENAYTVDNQYMFASQLLVAPITKPNYNALLMGSVDVWMPDGKWTDIFTGKMYNGNRKLTMHRDIAEIPVLAKEGAIISLAKELSNSVSNPENLTLWVFNGNSDFLLYEDDGQNNFSTIKYSVNNCDNALKFVINKPEGNITSIPKKRNYKIEFRNISSGDVKVLVNSKESKNFSITYDEYLIVNIDDISVLDKVEIMINNYDIYIGLSAKESVTRIFARWQTDNGIKTKIYDELKHLENDEDLKENINRQDDIPDVIKSALNEIF